MKSTDPGYRCLKYGLIICSMLTGIASTHNPVAASEPVNPALTNDARAVLGYINFLSNGSGTGVLSGQNVGHGDAIANQFNRYIGELYRQTGKYPGIIGGDYEYTQEYSLSDLRSANQILIDYWKNKKGIVTINMTPRGPGNIDPRSTYTKSLKTLITPGTSDYTYWMNKLNRLATALTELRDAGVPVLWRPMQEMNSLWFWYGTKNGHSNFEEFISVYRHMFDYFTTTKKLNNLIWVFSPVGAHSWSAYPDPGNDYWDIIAATHYNNDLDAASYQDMINFAKGKPVALGEYGPATSFTGGAFDNRMYLTQLKNNYPRVAYWVSWHDWSTITVSLPANKYCNELFADPYIISAPIELKVGAAPGLNVLKNNAVSLEANTLFDLRGRSNPAYTSARGVCITEPGDPLRIVRIDRAK
jgi:mannan endo-1,4-beta-mannosidase